MKADLHIHSTISDGSDTIATILDKAAQFGLTHISLTDHDTVEGVPLAILAGQLNGITVIPGVELSAYDYQDRVKVHILGYGMKDLDAISRLGAAVLDRRHAISLTQIDILQKIGYAITPDEVGTKAGRHVYKQHIMQVMVEKGYADSINGETYKRLFKYGGPCDFDIEYMDAISTIKAVKAAGGIAILAHPGQQGNFRLIVRFKRAGLDGLELNHHANSEIDRKILIDYANRYELMLTGGSDHHGEFEPGCPELGAYLCPESTLMRLLEMRPC